jgi:hypothetical protein
MLFQLFERSLLQVALNERNFVASAFSSEPNARAPAPESTAAGYAAGATPPLLLSSSGERSMLPILRRTIRLYKRPSALAHLTGKEKAPPPALP